MKVGDWVEIINDNAKYSKWSKGDIAKVLYISGQFVDIEDRWGGVRGKKGINGVQRFKKEDLAVYEEAASQKSKGR